MHKTLPVIVTAVLLAGCWGGKEPVYTICSLTSPKGDKIDLNIEVRNDEAGRAEGLMYRQSINEDEGMLFIWPDLQQRHMWMKNTLIPLDMIFLNNHTIVGIIENATPLSERVLTVPGLANRVLEVKGGSLLSQGVSSQWQLLCPTLN